MKLRPLDVGKTPKQGFCAYKIGFGEVCLLFVYLSFEN